MLKLQPLTTEHMQLLAFQGLLTKLMELLHSQVFKTRHMEQQVNSKPLEWGMTMKTQT